MDLEKRITAVGTTERGSQCEVVLKMDEGSLVVGAETFAQADAKVFRDGCVDGLRAAQHLSREQIHAFLDSSVEVATMEVTVPAHFSAADHALFNRGIVEGLKLAADGYWLDSRLTELREPK